MSKFYFFYMVFFQLKRAFRPFSLHFSKQHRTTFPSCLLIINLLRWY